MSFYINENPIKLTETLTAADRIRAKREVIHITEDMMTIDDLVKSGVAEKSYILIMKTLKKSIRHAAVK